MCLCVCVRNRGTRLILYYSATSKGVGMQGGFAFSFDVGGGGELMIR